MSMSFFQRDSASSSSSSSFAVPNTTIDIVLMLDITKSMVKHLNAAKTKLAELPAAIAKSNPHARVRVAVVAYSDYKADNAYLFNQFNPGYWLRKTP